MGQIWKGILSVTILVGMVILLSMPAHGQGTQYSLWEDATPSGDTQTYGAIELGVKFSSASAGQIVAIKFYKGGAAAASEVVHLWTSGGTMLAEANYTGEASIGWKTVTLASPVSIDADTIYVASYYTSTGISAYHSNYFSSGYTNSPLYAPSSSESSGNGVYHESTSGFPSSSYNSTNYWVDIVFEETTPEDTSTPTVTQTITVTPTETLTPTITETPIPGATETPIPTSTNTPDPTNPPGVAGQDITLSSGHVFRVERSINFGDAAIVFGLGVLWVTNILIGAVLITRAFIR